MLAIRVMLLTFIMVVVVSLCFIEAQIQQTTDSVQAINRSSGTYTREQVDAAFIRAHWNTDKYVSAVSTRLTDLEARLTDMEDRNNSRQTATRIADIDRRLQELSGVVSDVKRDYEYFKETHHNPYPGTVQ